MTKLTILERQKLIVLIIVGLFYSLGLAYFYQTLSSSKLTSDFFPRWHASHMLVTEGRSIYDWQNAEEISAVTGWPHLNQLGYYYPAYLMIFTVPLAFLPYEMAYIIWSASGLWCVWVGMVIFARTSAAKESPLSFNRLTWLLILMTVSIPMFQHTLYAQFNALGVLALALTYYALHRQKYFLAGVWAAGLLFKPQALMIPLGVLLLWAVFEKKRWPLGFGLAVASGGLWLIAELLEPNWVFTMLQTLDSYVPISSILDKFWNPYQSVALILFGLTFWFTVRLRAEAVDSLMMRGLLVWAINLNALAIPMFGMMHMVTMGISFVILLDGLMTHHPKATDRIWWGTVLLMIAGLVAFIGPLVLTDTPGLQITMSELIYRFTMPILFCLLSLPLMFKNKNKINP